MSGIPDTGIYAFQFRINFFRHPGASSKCSYSIKWKRGSKGENKGNTQEVKTRNADGDYIINEVFSFKSTMQRKDEAKTEKGFHHKWLDITVVQHSKKGDKKKKIFQAELDLAIVLPPQSDTTPHVLLCSKQKASLSLSFGYKKLKSTPSKSSIFSVCTSAPAPPPSKSKTEKRRSRSAGWWVNGSAASSPPNGRSTSAKDKNRVLFSDEPDNVSAAREPSGEPDNTSFDNQSQDAVPDEMQIQVNGVAVENKPLLPKAGHLGVPSYPAAPRSDADMLSMRSMISNKSSILGSSQALGSQSFRSGQLPRQRSKLPVLPILRDRPGSKSKKEEEEENDQVVYHHEIDVRPVKALQDELPCDNYEILDKVRIDLGHEDNFTSAKVVCETCQLSDSVDVGEVTIPRIWNLIWSRGSSFWKTLHKEVLDEKYSADYWDIDADPRCFKWRGDQTASWRKGKAFGKPNINETSYFAAFKIGERPSQLYVHTTRGSPIIKKVRVETVFRCSLNNSGKMTIYLSSMLHEDPDSKISEVLKVRLYNEMKHFHAMFCNKALHRTQVHLLKRAYQPKIYGAGKKLSITQVKRQCQQRLKRAGASMGTLGKLQYSAKFGSTKLRVRALNSYLQSTAGRSRSQVDPLANIPPGSRLEELPHWKKLSTAECLLSVNQTNYILGKVVDIIQGMSPDRLVKEGFSEWQVLVLSRLVAAHPNKSVLGQVLTILQFASSSSLSSILNAPSAVSTILAACPAVGGFSAMPEHAKFLTYLKEHQEAKSNNPSQSNSQLVRHFELSDSVLETFNCSLKDPTTGKHVSGVLYITKLWLCFLSDSTRMMISTYDIVGYELVKSFLRANLLIYAMNRCIDPTDVTNPHRQSQCFEFRLWFMSRPESIIKKVVKGGGRPRFRMSHRVA